MQSGRLTLGEVDRIVLPRKTLSHRRRIGRLVPRETARRFVLPCFLGKIGHLRKTKGDDGALYTLLDWLNVPAPNFRRLR